MNYSAAPQQGSPAPATGAPPGLGTPIPGTTGGLPAVQGLSVTANPMARELQTMGRGDDKMLVHMTPGEVGGLQQLALAHGGSLTINPHTGLPEAGFLSKILPTILGIAGAAIGIPTWAIGLGVGAGKAALSGDLGKGLSAGLQAFGGAGIGQAAGLGNSISKTGFGILGKGTVPTPPPGMFSVNTSGGPAVIPSAGAKGFLGKFAAETSLGQKGLLGKALPMMAGSAVLGGVSDAMQPKLPKYDPNAQGKSNYTPMVPGKREVRFQPYEEMVRTGGAEFNYFTPSNPQPRKLSDLTPEERAEYGFADGGLAQIPTPQGFNELVSFFNSANPGAVTASMYPSTAAPASPAAPAVGVPGTPPTVSTPGTVPNITPPASVSRPPSAGGPGTGTLNIPELSSVDIANILAQIGYAPKDGSPATTPIPERDIAYAPSTDLYRGITDIPDPYIISNPMMPGMDMDGLYYTTPSLNIQPPSQLYDRLENNLSTSRDVDYNFADGGLAQLPAPQGFNELTSFFNAANPGAITASMYPNSAAPATPAAPVVGAPGEQIYNVGTRPPSFGGPTPNSFSDIGYVDLPGVGNVMIPGFSGYDFGNIDFDAIARRQNYIPQAEQLVIREPDMTGIYDRFGSIENQLKNIPAPQAPDLTGIYDRFGQIEDRIRGIPQQQEPDLSGVYDRFGEIERRINNIPAPQAQDLSGVYTRFGEIENRLQNIAPTDLTGVYDRFGNIENQLRNIPTPQSPDLTGIYNRFGNIENQLRNIAPADLTGVYDRFGQIENRLQNIAPTDLTGVYDRFGNIENQLRNIPTPQAPDLSGIQSQIEALRGQYQPTDLSGIQSQIEALRGQYKPVDLSGIQSQIETLGGRISSLPTPQATDLSGIQSQIEALRGQYKPTDLSGIQSQIETLGGRISNLPTPQAPDLSGIQSQIEALRGQYKPTDLSGIQSQIEALGGRISNLPTPQATDLSGIQSQIEALRSQYQPTDLSGIQSQIEALRGQYQPTDLSGIQSQIEALGGRISNLPTPQAPDLSGIQSQIEALGGRISNLPTPQATDLSGIQSQIEALGGRISNIPAPQPTDLSGIQSQIEALRGQYQPTDLSGVQSQLQQLQELYSTLANPNNVTAPSISGGYTPSNLDTGGFYARGGEVDMSDGAFVVDARTVSELGNGSSNAGMDFLSRLGGRPLHGPGDGVSDSIPARIGGRQEARVARDEVIFQPDAVKRLGGGSEQRGTAKLYSLMDKAHKARKKAKRGEDTGLRKALA